MAEEHRFIVDRHEGAVTVDGDADRTVVTIQRDAAATSRAQAEARATVERLKKKDPGGDLSL